jgi:putative tryptophan/tyrosine transport system substrate-binding protein
VNRREFITLLSGAATWPLAARAQQPAMPVIGFLRSSREQGFGHLVAAFPRSKRERLDGGNVTIEFRWADDSLDRDRLPALAADLVYRHVTVIVANYGSMAAAMVATKTIPIVFVSGEVRATTQP